MKEKKLFSDGFADHMNNDLTKDGRIVNINNCYHLFQICFKYKDKIIFLQIQ